MSLHMIFDGMTSTNGFQSNILERIDAKLHFDKCILIDRGLDGQDVYGEKYLRVNYDVCAHTKYEEAYDLEAMKSLDRATMEAMRHYEPMTIKMLMRMYEVSFFTYEEAKRMYYQHLRFWNHMIETNGINYIVLTAVPHHTHQYLLYALARIKKIKLCVLTVCQIVWRRIACNDLKQIGSKITQEYYANWQGKKQVELPADIETFYQRKIYSNISVGEACMMTKKEMAVMIGVIQSIYYQDVAGKRLYKACKKAIKGCFTGRQPLKERWRISWQDADHIRRARKKMRKMVSPAYFDKMAKLPDLNEKYVVYFLHYQPEATTMPQGGEFVEQEQAIRILAEALNGTGIRLYVKEHFVQQKRNPFFYDDLAKIKNVTLIRSDVGSKEVIKNSVAVSTCTGTVTLEAIINGVPSMVFGQVGLDEGPGIYPVSSAKECREVIDMIQRPNYKIEEQEVRNYLRAFAEHSFRAYTGGNAKQVEDLSMQESIDNTAEAIVEQWYKE